MTSILHVDSDTALLKAAQHYFSQHGGLTVKTVTSVKEALDLLIQEKFDAIVSAYDLPDRNGTEFLRSLRERGDTTPFIFFSETGSGTVAIDALNLGADSFILKGKKPDREFERLAGLITKAAQKKQGTAPQSFDARTLEILFNTSPDEITITDLKGTITAVSQRGLGIFGLTSPDEVIGKSVFDWIVPEYHEDARRNLRSVIDGTHDLPHEYQLMRKDGTLFWAEINAALLRDGNGNPTGMISIVRDISERKRIQEELSAANKELTATEEELRKLFREVARSSQQLWESEKRYRNLVESISDLVWEVDATGTYTYVSPNARNILGYEPAEIIGKTPFSFMPKEEAEKIAKYFSDCVRDKKPIEKLENRNIRKDGRIIVLETRGVPILNSRGEVKGYRGIDRDITERKWMEILLTESEEKFRALAETTSAAIVIYQNARWVYANHAAEVLSGYSKDEILSMNFWDIVHPDYRELVKSFGRARMRDEVRAPRQLEIRIIRKDGEVRWIDLTAGTITFREKTAGILTVIDITGRKNAEAELKKSEEKYRAIFNSFDDLYYQTDMNGIITNVSPSCMKMTGFSPVEIIGRPVLGLYPFPEQRAGLLKKLSGGGPVQDYEIILTNKAGELLNVSVNCHLVRDSHGRPTGIEGTLRNITDRKRIENELKDSEDYLKTIFNSVQTGLMIIDPEAHTIVDVNPAAVNLIGADRDTIVGKICHRFICPAEEGNCPITDLGQDVDNKERILIKADGERIPILKTVVPILLNGKKHLLESFTDISKRVEAERALQKINEELETRVRKRTEALETLNEQLQEEIKKRQQVMAALKESEEMYRGLVEHIMDIVFEINTEGKIIYCSPSVLDLLGYTPEELIGKNGLELIVPEDRTHFLETFNLHRPVTGFVLSIFTKTGERGTVEANAGPFFLPDGTFNGYHGILRDITEREKMQSQLSASLQEKEVMLKEIHHRVKNNLQVISSLLNLQAKQVKDERVREIMRVGMNRVRSIALIHEKLYQSRTLSSIDYSEYIRKMAGYLFQTYNVDPGLIQVTVDADKILFTIDQAIPVSLMLNELLSNALKYAFPDGRAGQIRIDIHKEGDNYIFIVADNGVGLPEGIDLEKTDTLGLQLVDTLVKQVQGSLEIERGGGTLFRIRFPAA